MLWTKEMLDKQKELVNLLTLSDITDDNIEGCSMYQDWEKEQYLKEEFGGVW